MRFIYGDNALYHSTKNWRSKTSLAISNLGDFISCCPILKDEKRQFLDELIIIKARYSELSKSKIKGTVPSNENRQLNLIHNDLLWLLTETEKCISNNKPIQTPRLTKEENEVILKEETTSIEIIINRDYDNFSEMDQKKLLQAIENFLEMKEGDLKIKKKKRRSVKMEFDLPPAKAERLLWAIRRGEFDAFQVVDAYLRLEMNDVELERDSMLDQRSSLHSLSKESDGPIENQQKRPTNDVTQNLGIVVKLFGKLEIHVDAVQLPKLSSRKSQGILSYLLYLYPRSILREDLIEIFWPNVRIASSRNSLNVELHRIRKAFKIYIPDSDPIIYKNGAYSLNTDWEIKIDVHDFLAQWKKAQSLERATGVFSAISLYEKAANLYTDSFLNYGLNPEWVQIERDYLQEIYLTILERLVDCWIELEEYENAHKYGKDLLRLDPCRENIHRQIMVAYCKSGRRNQAILQYQRCCKILKEELNLAPSPKTQELFEKIKSGEIC